MSDKKEDHNIAESTANICINKMTAKQPPTAILQCLQCTDPISSIHRGITYQQAEQIIKLTEETNALMKRLLGETVSSARKRLRFDDVVEMDSITTLEIAHTDSPGDNHNHTEQPGKFVSAPANMSDICPLPLKNKSKKVLHVVDCRNTVLEVIDTVGFWTLEYHVSGSKSVSLFVPSPANWFREYATVTSPSNEPTDMTDCMVQIMVRLLNHYTATSSIHVVPFVLSLESHMTREDICMHIQKHAIVLSDPVTLCVKTHALTVVSMNEGFGVVLYHIGHEKNGYYHPTVSLICSNVEKGKHYCIAGVADYFSILFGISKKSFRSEYRVHTFNDSCGNNNAYNPWSFEQFNITHAAFTKDSHMMTIRLVLSFVCAHYKENDTLNGINNDLIGWRGMYNNNRHPAEALRFHISKICYDMMIQAILEKLYKPVRDEVGQWCGHLDPFNTCQTIKVMVSHFIEDIKGKWLKCVLLVTNFVSYCVAKNRK